jgi:hypothetical protein
MTGNLLRKDSEFGQTEGGFAIPPSERVAELVYGGLSSEQAVVAVYGGGEPAVDSEQANRIRIARAELAATQKKIEKEAAA